jgi:hypothetical protein
LRRPRFGAARCGTAFRPSDNDHQPQSLIIMKKHTLGLLAAAVLALAATAAFALEARENATATAGGCSGCCESCQDCTGCCTN